jgi:type I restriction enzyme M protein
VVGYYDVEPDRQYRRAITVAYNGSWPIMAKFHPYAFGAKDDVAVLKPLVPMTNLELAYVAALLNRMTWRYSYGRKCFREKLQNVEIPAVVVRDNGRVCLDSGAIQRIMPYGLNEVIRTVAAGAERIIAVA